MQPSTYNDMDRRGESESMWRRAAKKCAPKLYEACMYLE